MSYLADFEDSLVLADAEVVWHGNLPLGGLLADVESLLADGVPT